MFTLNGDRLHLLHSLQASEMTCLKRPLRGLEVAHPIPTHFIMRLKAEQGSCSVLCMSFYTFLSPPRTERLPSLILWDLLVIKHFYLR